MIAVLVSLPSGGRRVLEYDDYVGIRVDYFPPLNKEPKVSER